MGDAVTSYRIKQTERQIRRDCAELAYHYPVYTLEDAFDLPIGDRQLLLRYARLHRAEQMLELTNVIASAQTTAGYKKKAADLEGVIKDLTDEL